MQPIKQYHLKTKQSGFSLIELSIVLALAIGLSVMALDYEIDQQQAEKARGVGNEVAEYQRFLSYNGHGDTVALPTSLIEY